MKQEETGVGEAGTPAGLLTGEPKKETYWTILIQVIFPFFAAGMGMSYAGIILKETNETKVFQTIKELIAMVPILLGLKGNLEMTFASRLSTYTNIGTMSSSTEQVRMIGANLLLVQVQAIIVSLASSLITCFMYLVTQETSFYHLVLLCASTTLSASIASLVLGSLTALVIVTCKACNWNPDNIATPVVAALGDVVSIIFLKMTSSYFYDLKEYALTLPLIVIAIYLLLLPAMFIICRQNKYTGHILYHGWVPIVIAMFIGLGSGLVLDKSIERHRSIAVFQVLINGVGGNLAAIQASRMSTSLHQQGLDMGVLPEYTNICITPWAVFFSQSTHSLTARVLMSVLCPGQWFFLYIIIWWQFPNTDVSPAFYASFLTAGVLQVVILLYLVHVLTHLLWHCQIDPDNSTIPYLTSTGDLLGTVFLGITFEFLTLLGLNID